MDFLRTIGGKVVGGLVFVAAVIMLITWWSMDRSSKDNLVSGTLTFFKGSMLVLGWLLIVGIIPWATFYFIGWVARFERNIAGVLLILLYTSGEAVLLAWMFNWSVRGSAAIVFFSAATLLAGAYNLFACDWIAEKVE